VADRLVADNVDVHCDVSNILLKCCTLSPQNQRKIYVFVTDFSYLVHVANLNKSSADQPDRREGPTDHVAEKCVKLKVKVKLFMEHSSRSYGVSLAIWDHTVLPAARHK